MRKIVIHCTTGTVGTDSWEFVEFPDDITDEELNDYAWEAALSNAEMYGIYNQADYSEEEDGDDEDEDWACAETYSDDIDGHWMDYDPEEHDGHRCGSDETWQQA